MNKRQNCKTDWPRLIVATHRNPATERLINALLFLMIHQFKQKKYAKISFYAEFDKKMATRKATVTMITIQVGQRPVKVFLFNIFSESHVSL